MKTDIHPEYTEATVTCVCGNTFTTRSTVGDIKLEICSECHPFFTGRQKVVDTAGRIDKFNQRFAKSKSMKAAKNQKKEDAGEGEEKEGQDSAAE